MTDVRKKYLMIGGGILSFAIAPFFIGGALAGDGATNTRSITNSSMFTSEQAVYDYWTADRMTKAIPMPMPEYETPPGATDTEVIKMEKTAAAELAVPHISLGWLPGSGPQPDPRVGYEVARKAEVKDAADFQTYGTAPTNPKDGPYPPFQRWTWYQNYLNQATATIGKLFFTDGIYNYSCTASVIGSRTIATAAHCIHKGGPGADDRFYDGWLFCPSFYRGNGSGEPHPSRGCWTWDMATVSNAWVNTEYGAADRDYGCIVTHATGNTVSDKVGNVTGWTGRAWNFPSQQSMAAWGYPASGPFPGYHIIVAMSPEWYEVDMNPGDGQVSKYMGNDMLHGASGGPWWASLAHNTYEYDDTDDSQATDPGAPDGPFLNGLNSHKRCINGCYSPPTTNGGIFWQEMGSPQFRGTAGDNDESEDIFKSCLDFE